MARYTGPQFKKSRRYGFSILESGKEFAKGKSRKTAPGQHGAKRQKLSDFGLHLYEKQKVKYMYGISEKQMKSTFHRAAKMKGIAGINLLLLLESRLDNTVYRMGFASTRRQARQLVNHGHFLLNGKKADIPSMQVAVGDKIIVREKSKDLAPIKEAIDNRKPAEWMERKGIEGTPKRLPARTDLNKEVNEGLIAEYYTK